MPTLVGLPQVQNFDTSGSKPLYNAHTSSSGNIVDFLMGVGSGIKAKQDENKEADQALGEIDAINGVTRDVGLFHQENYKAGQQYGAIVQDHVKKDMQFKQSVDDMLASNPDATPEDVAALATQTAQEEVATVYASSNGIRDKSLLADMYKQIPKFYAQRLVDGQKAIIAAAGQRLDNIRGTGIADFIGYLNKDTYDAPSLVNKYSTTLSTLRNAYLAAGKTQIEATNAAESDMLSAASTIKEIAKLDPTSDGSIKWANNTKTLLGSILTEPSISSDFKIKMAGIVDDIAGKVMAEGDAMSSMETANFKLTKLSNPRTMETSTEDIEVYLAREKRKFENREISASQYASNVNGVVNAYSEFQGKKVTLNPLPAQLAEMSFNQAQHDYGTSASEWSDAKLASFNDRYHNDRSKAAYMAIGFATSGESYMPELVQKAGLQAYREFGGALKMSPDQFAKLGEGSKYMAESYAKFKAVYSEALANGSPMADDLLAALPDESREAIRENVTTGGTLGDLQTKLSAPVDYKTKSSNFDAQVSNPNYKKMELGKYWGGTKPVTSNSFWGSKPTDTDMMKEAYAQSLATVYKNDKSYYIDGATTTLASNIVSNMSSKGSLVQSPKGYTASGINIPKIQAISKAVGSGADTDYVLGHTLDLYREQYAKSFKTDAKNIIVYSTGFGANGRIAFDIYNKDGTARIAGATLDMHSLTNQVRKNYVQFKQDVKSNEASHTPTGFDDGDARNSTPLLYNAVGTFKNNVVVKGAWGGQDYRVNLPNTATLPYNGNAELTQDAINHLNLWEGWHDSIKQVNGAKTYTVAQQVLVVDQHGRKTKYYDMAKQARTQQDLMNLQGQYMKENMGALQPAARKIGIPVATTAVYPTPFKQYQMLLTDAIWLGGTGGMNDLVNVLTKNTDAVQAVKQLKQTSYFQNLQHDRKIWVGKTIANYMELKKKGYLYR